MNRRNIVLLTGLGAAALFAGGAYLYTQHAAPTPATPEMAAIPPARRAAASIPM
jgi:hypothetical protein